MIPWVGKQLEIPFKEFLTKQKEKLHRKSENVSSQVYAPYQHRSIYHPQSKFISLKDKLYTNYKIYPLIFTEPWNSRMDL